MAGPDFRSALRLVALCASGLACELAWANLAPTAPPAGTGAAPQSTVLVASPAPASTAAEKQAWKSGRIEAANFKKFVRQFGAESLDEGALLRAKSAWLWYRLTYPTGTLPSDPWGRAAEHIRRYVVDAEPWPLEGAPLLPPESMPPSAVIEPELNTWVEFGPRPLDSTGTTNNAYQYGIVAGRLNVVVSDPTNRGAGAGDRAWLGFAAGGLWRVDGIRSVDCSVSPCDVTGVTATPMWDGLIASTQGVSAIEIDPNDASGDTVYVGTGDWQANDQFSAGILKTDDGGASWSHLAPGVFTPFSNLVPPDQANGGCPGCIGNRFSNQNIKAIEVDPHDAQRILVGTRNDLYISHDGGAAWEICNFGSNHTNPEGTIGGITGVNRVSGIYVDGRSNPARVYVAVGYLTTANNHDNGVYGFDMPAAGCPAWPGAFTNYFDGLPANTGTAAGSRTGRIELDGRVDSDGFLTLYAQVQDAQADAQGGLPAFGTYVMRPDNPAWPTAAGNPAVKDWRLLTGSGPAAYDTCTGAASGTGQDWYDLFLRASPVTDRQVYIGHIDAFKTQIDASYTALGLSAAANITNAYGTTCPSYGRIHPDQHGFDFVRMPGDPEYGDWILLANDGGIYLNTEGGAVNRWTSLARVGIGTNQFYAGQVGMDFGDLDDNGSRGNPNDGRQWLFGGMQDNGTASWDSSRPDLQWTARGIGGDGLWAAFDSLGGTTSAGYWLSEYVFGELFCSTTGADGPFGPASCSPSQFASESPDWSTPIVMDQFHCTDTQCGNVVVGGDRVYASTAYGTPAWTQLGTAVMPITEGGGSIVSMAVAPSEPKAVVAGTDNGKWWWTETAFAGPDCTHAKRDSASFACAPNGVAVWRQIDAGNAVLPNRVLGGVAFDPTNHNIVYAALHGFSENTPATPGHLFRAVWDGVSFTVEDKSGNLPDVPAQGVAVNPHNPNQVFLGTLFGFYYTDDVTAASPVWLRYMEGLPNSPIFHLAVDRGPLGDSTASTTLAAFTYGRGVWAIKLPGAGETFCPNRPLAPTGVTATAAGTNEIQVSWNDSPSLDVDSYRIHRSTSPGGPYFQVGSVPDTGVATSYQFSSSPVSGGTTFYFVVRAVDGSCESFDSNEALATATGDCLRAPEFDGATAVTALGGGQGCGLRVSWNAGTSQCGGALTYSVYRSTNRFFVPSASDRIASCVAGTSFDDTASTGLPVDTDVYYVVRAEDAGAVGGGPCNGGNVESNSNRISGLASASPGSPIVYFNDFETGVGLSDWAVGNFNGIFAPDWRGIRTCSGNGVFRFGGAGNCNSDYSDDVFAFAQPDGNDGIAIPPGSTTVRLSFRHHWQFETGHDGAMLAVSLDGTNYTYVHPNLILDQTYNGVTDGGAGYEAWTGLQLAFVESTVDLDAACIAAGAPGGCAGQDLRIAFVGYSDGAQNLDGWYLDDVAVTRDAIPACLASPPNPVQFLTATGKNEQVTAQWIAPPFGSYASTRLNAASGAPPADPTQGTILVDEPGAIGDREQFVHATGAGSNGTAQHYAAFANNGGGNFSARRTVAGLPQATDGNWKWNFSTPASALAPPIQGRGIGVYVPSNDRGFYALGVGAGAAGGLWKSGYTPAAMNAPAQSSPIVMLAADTGLPHDAAFVGSQDGFVYCFRADTGAGCSGWPAGGRSVSDFGLIQAQPMFDPVTKRILVGTRNTLLPNALVAINVLNGVTAWSFTNAGSQGGDDLPMGIVSSPALILGSQVVFTSRMRLGGSSHTVWALDFTAGDVSLAWARDLGNIDAAPTHEFTNNHILIGTNAGEVFALDPAANGAILWSRSFGDGAVKTFLYFDSGIGRLYFATNDTVWAIPANGTVDDWSLSGLVSPTRPLAHFGTTRTYVGACNDAACASGRVIELDSANGWATPKTLDLAGVGGLSPVTIDRSQSPALLHAGSRSGRAVAVELPLP